MSNIKIPGYRILKQLGQGGMSSVYLAEQLSFGREVAVKVMSRQLAAREHFGDRFLREARIAAQLSHPNIVSVYDTGFTDGAYFLAMEYLSGGHLGHRLGAGLALLESLDIIEDAAYALDHAAGKGVVHRDIKPGNIMFRADGSLALVDFGIARDLSTETMVTQAGTILGTPHYMSPEQSLGEHLDSRSDLYSLGVVFFELLTGHVPFTADSAAAVGVKHLTEEVPTLPDDLTLFQAIIDRALAKAPEDRYQSGAELVADLLELRELIPADLQTTILTSNAYIFDTDSQLAPGSGPASRRSTTRRRRRRSQRQRRSKIGRVLAVLGGTALCIIAGVYVLAPVGSFSRLTAAIGWTNAADTPIVAVPVPESAPAPAVPDDDVSTDASTALPASTAPRDSRLDSLARQYVARANTALDAGLLQQAQNFIDLAVALGPAETNTAQALEQVITRKAGVAEAMQELQSMRNRYQQQLERGAYYAPPEDNAYLSLARIAELAPDNRDLASSRERLDSLASEQINGELTRGQLDQAAAAIESLSRLASPGVVAPLQTRLDTLTRARQVRAGRVAALLAEASGIEGSGENRSDTNTRLLQLYSEASSLEPKNRRARQGLAESSRIAIEASAAAMNAGDLKEARGTLDEVGRLAPRSAGLGEQKTRLALLEARRNQASEQLEKTREQVSQLTASSKQEITSNVRLQRRANAFVQAWEAVEAASRLDPTTPGLALTRRQIEQAYTAEFTHQVERDELESATVYLEALTDSSLSGADIRDILDSMNGTLAAATRSKRDRFPSF
jgi:serine/threonine protein kinase